MMIPSPDDELTVEIPDEAKANGELAWSAEGFTCELSEESPTDPLTRPFDVDDWLDEFAGGCGVAPDALTVVQPEPPDDFGAVAVSPEGKEVRAILFSSDDGDLRRVRFVFAEPVSKESAARLVLRAKGRGFAKGLDEILGL